MYHHAFRLTICGVLLTLAACAPQPTPTPPAPPVSSSAGQPQPPRIEEITFRSGSFHVVGDLKLPEGTGPHPVILFVHGSGPADRTGTGYNLPIMERMQRAGYATFSWDKPGTGESTGSFDERRLKQQRAQIVLEAIEVMKARPDIAPGQIGLWGISQAGYVMPRVLAQSKDVAFMICVSCPGISSYDQMAFQVTALALCNKMPAEKAAEKTRLLAELDRARSYETYAEYLHYREVLKALAGLVSAPIEQWPALSETTWQKNPLDPEDFWNPIEMIDQTKISVLAIFGDQDRQMDSLQAAYAYRKALEQAGNPKSRVELYPKANHGIVVSETGCPEDDQRWQEQYVQSLGYASLNEALAALVKDPYNSRLLSAFPYAPGFLDTMEEWLKGLRQ